MRMIAARTYLVATLLTLAATAGGQWVEDSVDVGGAWVGDLVYNSREDVVYGGCQFVDGIFFAISCSDNQILAQWTQSWPRRMAYDSIDNKAYLAFGDDEEDSVVVIDGTTHQRIKAIPLASATTPVWDPVNNKVYVSCQRHYRLGVIDCVTDSLVGEIPVGDCALTMQLNTRHHKLYVQNYDDHTVSVVDLDTDSVIRTLPVSGEPIVGLYSSLVDKYYCGSHPYVYVFDGSTDSLLARVALPVGAAPTSIALAERSGLLFVGTSDAGDTIFVLDARADTVVAKLRGGRSPRALFWSRRTDQVYAANTSSDNLAVYSGAGAGPIVTFPVGDAPCVLAHSPIQDRLYLGHYNSGKVYVLRDAVGGICEEDRRIGPVAGLGAFPNPFRAAVRLYLHCSAFYDELLVYATTGRLVRHVKRDNRAEGTYEWDGRDELGVAVPAGVYIATGAGKPAVQVRLVKLR